MSAQKVVCFGSFEFDVTSGELRNSGRRVPLQTQPAQVLAQLVSTPREVVTRDELRRTLWADDTFVDFDTALNVAISKIRHALRDSASTPRFVETLPRRGYRFLADIRPVGDAPKSAPAPEGPDPPPNEAVPSRRTRWAWAGLALTLVVLVVWAGNRWAQPAATTRSLAVLPFRPLVSDMPDDALQVALAEAVIVRLGELRQLRVPSIHAVRRYATSDLDARVAGRELGVETVLESTLLRRNGTVRLTARLIDVGEGTSLWSGRWDFPWTDIFSVQDVIATEVTRALALRLGADEQARLHRHPTNLAAYDAYLRARALMLRLTADDSRRAIEKLEDAVRLDPGSSHAHATLAFAYIMVGILDGPREPNATLARRAADRARELDPASGEAYGSLGRILFHFDWNTEGALEHMRKALELEPNNLFVLHCASRLFADLGHTADALALVERALALDPASALANRDKVMNLVLARRYQEAVEQAQKALELDPYDPITYRFLGTAYERLHRDAEAVEAYIKPLTFSEEHRARLEMLRDTAQRDGLRGYYRQTLALLLEQEPPRRPSMVARTYLKLGDIERTLDWLERLHAEQWPWLPTLEHDPEWDALHDHRRFQRLLARVDGQAAHGTARLESNQPR